MNRKVVKRDYSNEILELKQKQLMELCGMCYHYMVENCRFYIVKDAFLNANRIVYMDSKNDAICVLRRKFYSVKGKEVDIKEVLDLQFDKPTYFINAIDAYKEDLDAELLEIVLEKYNK